MPKKVWKHPCKSDGKHTGIYNTWRQMLSRCADPKHKSYKDYGAKGIAVCDEWLSYDAFYEWSMANGWQEGLTIDRLDNSSGYEPSNCKWESRKTQNKNKSTVAIIAGETLSQIAKRTGINYGTVYYRYKHGKPLEAPLAFGKSAEGGGL